MVAKVVRKPRLRIIPEKGTKQLASIVLFSWRRRNRDHGAAAQVHDGLPLLPTCQCSRCGAVAPSFFWLGLLGPPLFEEANYLESTVAQDPDFDAIRRKEQLSGVAL